MNKVILSPNPYRDKGFKTAQVAQKILTDLGVQTRMCLPFNVDRNFELPKNVKLYDLNQELKETDMLICFGGDGTILHSSKQATLNQVPILCVNVGNMGFMAELESNELHLLERAVRGEYTLDNRLMLDVQVRRGEEVLYQDIALNDAVVTKGAVAREIQLQVLCDGVQATEPSGDGVIVCTPTGSTAYSLSAGGPIVEPTAQNLIITPICAHALSAKSFVLSSQRVVTIKASKNGRKNAYLSVDGGRAVRLNTADEVIIRRSEHETKLVRIKDTSFYSVINNKFRNRW